MKKLLLIASFMLSTSSCFALLSPLNHSLEEVQAIVLSNELQKLIPQDQAIFQIQRIQNGYVVRTERSQIFVEIQYIPNDRPGKQQFKLVFHESQPAMTQTRGR